MSKRGSNEKSGEMYKWMDSENTNLARNDFTREDGFLIERGQRVIYEGEEAYIINLKPVMVIKTKSKIICGALRDRLKGVGDR